MTTDLKKAYRTILGDAFPTEMEISFGKGDEKQTLFYEKVTWEIDGERKGLRYGDNPGQEAALYRLTNGNLVLGNARSIQSGHYLVSDMELLQSGKHPGKTNLTDADSALNILRYLMNTPVAVIVKHNNPCGVAKGKNIYEAYEKAYLADRVAAFGGCIAVNRAMDKQTAEAICEQYAEVVIAPSFEEGVMDIFAQKKNLRVIEIAAIDRLAEFATQRVIEFKSLIDGGIVTQWSFVPDVRRVSDFLPAKTEYKGTTYAIKRPPTATEYEDMLFGWLVEAGVTSNSVLYVKNGVTVGIGTGEQDRVGVAQIARDKAYRKLQDRYSFEKYNKPYHEVDVTVAEEISARVAIEKGGLIGAAMVSDAFFPFRDGVEVGIKEGITSVVQPGGALHDYDVIDACNEAGVTMVFTGQRSFRH